MLPVVTHLPWAVALLDGYVRLLVNQTHPLPLQTSAATFISILHSGSSCQDNRCYKMILGPVGYLKGPNSTKNCLAPVPVSCYWLLLFMILSLVLFVTLLLIYPLNFLPSTCCPAPWSDPWLHSLIRMCSGLMYPDCYPGKGPWLCFWLRYYCLRATNVDVANTKQITAFEKPALVYRLRISTHRLSQSSPWE